MNLDGLGHVDFFEAQHASTHHASLELLADGVGGVKETLHAFDQTSVGGWVDGHITGRHDGSSFVQLLLGLQQNERSGGRGAGGADGLENALEAVGNISVNARSQLRNARLQHTLSEVIQLHRQFGRRKVHADVLLGSNSQGRVLFVVVLRLQSSTVGHESAIRQADTQRGTDFSAFNGEGIVVLAVDVTGDYQVVLEDFERFTGNHVNSKKAICHDIFLK